MVWFQSRIKLEKEIEIDMNIAKTRDTSSDALKRVRHKAHLLGYKFCRALLPDHVRFEDLFQCFPPDEQTLHPASCHDRGRAMSLSQWEEVLDDELSRIPEGQRPGLKRIRRQACPDGDEVQDSEGQQA